MSENLGASQYYLMYFHCYQSLFSLLSIHFRVFNFQNNIPENKIDTFGGKVCTFGSYRLGVHTKGMHYTSLGGY